MRGEVSVLQLQSMLCDVCMCVLVGGGVCGRCGREGRFLCCSSGCIN